MICRPSASEYSDDVVTGRFRLEDGGAEDGYGGDQSLSDDRAAELREAFFQCAWHRLHGGDGNDQPQAAAKTRLADWGFPVEQLDRLPLGLISDLAGMSGELRGAGFTLDEIVTSSLLSDPRLDGRLVGPICDLHGQIVSFWAHHPEGQKPRCLYFDKDWKQQVALYGLDTAHASAAEGVKDIVVVEDLLDALLLHGLGLQETAAIGCSGKDMTPQRWERLAALGVQRVTLVLEDLHSARQGTEIALENAARANSAPEILVVPPSALPADMTLNELICSLHARRFREFLEKQRIHGHRYSALAILARHKQDGPWTEATSQAVLDEAATFYAAAHPRNILQLDAFFVPPILDALGLNWKIGIAGQKTNFARLSNGKPVPPREPSVGDDGSASAGQSDTNRATSGYCEIHQCDRMRCFCWD